MKNFIITLATLALLLSGETVSAQFTLSGEYRPRTEYRHGYRSLADEQMNAGFFIDQRARINFDFSSERYSFKLVLQDVRTWGAEPQLVVGDGKWTTLHEAWAKINFSEKFALKLGRQEIIYDDHRIFGNVGWTQQARSHDAAIFQFDNNGWRADVGFAFNQERPQSTTTYYGLSRSYKAFQTIWINKKTENFNGSFLFLNNGMEGGTVDDPKTFYSQTVGIRLGGNLNAWNGHFVYYYQGGKMRDGVTKLNASLIGFDIGYKLTKRAFVQVGYERQSGNSELNQDPNTNNAFTPLYGTNHKFNGFMDYFYVGNFVGSVGLNDLYLRSNYTMSKFVLTAFVHAFSAANDVADPLASGALNSYLGTEVDLILSYNLAKDINFKAGYSQMFATSTMEVVKGGSKDATSNWGWLMITLKPKFFSTADKDH